MECNHKFELLPSWNVLVCSTCGYDIDYNYIEDLKLQLDKRNDDTFVSLVEAEISEEGGIVWEEYKL